MHIKVKNLSLTYPIRSADSAFLRKKLVNKLLKKQIEKKEDNDVTTMNKIDALKNINFEIFEGDKLGVVGSNGSGKSTLISCLSGILEPNHGSKIDINGTVTPIIDPSGLAEPTDTVLNNIILIGQILCNDKQHIKQKLNEIVDFSELKKYQMVRYSNLSSGMKLKLITSILLFIKTEILISDEFFVIGDERFQQKIFNFFGNKNSKKNITVICSHSRDLINKFCNKILVLDKGNRQFFGDVDEGFRLYENILKNNYNN